MRDFSKVSPRIWLDYRFRGLSEDGKLTFFWMLSNPGQTSVGAFRGSSGSYAAEIAWPLERAEAAFLEIEAAGMIERDDAACLVVIPKFLKHNPPTGPNCAIALGKILRNLPECKLREQHQTRVLEFAKSLGGKLADYAISSIEGTHSVAKALPSACQGVANWEKSRKVENKNRGGNPVANASGPPSNEFLEQWNRHAKMNGWTPAQAMTVSRTKALRVRLQDPVWRDSWKEALVQGGTSAFLRGENERGWKADAEWFLRPDTVTKIIEGKYGSKDGGGAPMADAVTDDPELVAWAARLREAQHENPV